MKSYKSPYDVIIRINIIYAINILNFQIYVPFLIFLIRFYVELNSNITGVSLAPYNQFAL